MAVETLPETLPQTAGLVLTGNYLSEKVQPGNEDGKGGRWPDRYIVTVLVGDRTVQVEYRDEAAAKEALASGALEDHGPDMTMCPVRLAVGVRAAKGYVFYYGRRA